MKGTQPEIAMKFLAFLSFLFVALPAAAQTGLGQDEQQIVQAVDAERERTIELLERLVNQNSGSLNLAGVEAVGKTVRAELEPLGFDVPWVDMRETGRPGHTVATPKGSGKAKPILLHGHLPPAFAPDSPLPGPTP